MSSSFAARATLNPHSTHPQSHYSLIRVFSVFSFSSLYRSALRKWRFSSSHFISISIELQPFCDLEKTQKISSFQFLLLRRWCQTWFLLMEAFIWFPPIIFVLWYSITKSDLVELRTLHMLEFTFHQTRKRNWL